MDTQYPVDNAWHHHCIVYDGSVLTYHLDGEPAVPVRKRLSTSPGPMCLGGLLPTRADFNGDIDELVLFDRALTFPEVQQLFEMGNEGTSLLGPAALGK